MPVSADITLLSPDIMILGGPSQQGISFTNAKTSGLAFGIVSQVFSGCTITEGTYVMFKLKDVEVIIISGNNYFLIPYTNVRLTETAAA